MVFTTRADDAVILATGPDDPMVFTTRTNDAVILAAGPDDAMVFTTCTDDAVILATGPDDPMGRTVSRYDSLLNCIVYSASIPSIIRKGSCREGRSGQYRTSD
jgi:hypothetical protein